MILSTTSCFTTSRPRTSKGRPRATAWPSAVTVVTREGFPSGYEVFDGNRTDGTTVEDIVETMETRYGKADRVWVMDRGMTSAENLQWLQEGERKYVIGTPKSELRKWEQELVERDGWKQIREDVEVKLCHGPEGEETFILCRSADRTSPTGRLKNSGISTCN